MTPSMSRLLRLAPTWLLVALGFACAVDDKQDKELLGSCEELCTKLETCGMLPSWFGRATGEVRDYMEDCKARCLLSEVARVQLDECVSTPPIDPTNSESEWCNGEACASLAACLRSSGFAPGDLGVGTVRAKWTSHEDVQFETSVGDPFHCDIRAGSATSEESTSSADLCMKQYGALSQPTSVSISLETPDGHIPIASGTCAQIVGLPHMAENVPVGAYRPSMTMRSDIGGVCVKLYERLIVVKAGSTSEARFEMPSSGDGGGDEGQPDFDAFPCEPCDGTTISDQDGDGFVGCEDPDCAPVCSELLNCSDMIDNDGDGLVDCQDPDCITSLSCPPEAGTTETG